MALSMCSCRCLVAGISFFGIDDQKNLHHADVFMRQDVAVIDGLADVTGICPL